MFTLLKTYPKEKYFRYYFCLKKFSKSFFLKKRFQRIFLKKMFVSNTFNCGRFIVKIWNNDEKSLQHNYIYDLNEYVLQKIKIKYKKYDLKAGKNNDTNMLLCLVKGHNGVIAADYANTLFPYELYSTKEYQNKEYEAALHKTFVKLHKELLNSDSYVLEEGQPQASGASLSVVLVTPEITYFASLGDSPILACQHNDNKEVQEFYGDVIKNKRIKSSVSKLMANSSQNLLVTHQGGFHNQHNIECKFTLSESKVPSFKQKTEDGSYCLKIGGGIKAFGSIGDGLYDFGVFNDLLTEVQEFKIANENENLLKIYKTEKVMLNAFATYLDTTKGPRNSYISSIINFEDTVNNKFLIDLLLHGRISPITKDPIIRIPTIQHILNDDLQGVLLTTKNMIESQSLNMIEPLIDNLAFNLNKGFEDCFSECINLKNGLGDKPTGGILCWYMEKPHKEPREKSRTSYRQFNHESYALD